MNTIISIYAFPVYLSKIELPVLLKILNYVVPSVFRIFL